jgi:hypothetical protein
MQMIGELSEVIVCYRTAMPIDHQHPRRGAFGERLLGDEFWRKMEVEVGNEHGLWVTWSRPPSAGSTSE